MARMYTRWCDIYPEGRALIAQNLRDYVSYLRRRGYERRPHLRANEVVEELRNDSAEALRFIPQVQDGLSTHRGCLL